MGGAKKKRIIMAKGEMEEPLLDYTENPSEKRSTIEDDFNYGNNVLSSSQEVQKGFLRKVYGILTVQIFMTIGVSAICMAFDPVKVFLQANPAIPAISGIGCFGLLIALMIHRRNFPTNFILLGAFTFLESISIATVVTYYQAPVVIRACLITLSVFCLLTSFTLQSKKDYSSWGAALFSFLWILIGVSLMHILFPTEIMDTVISFGGAALFSLFIIYDTHMLMRRLSAEEYIFAAINLYLDILNLFLHILRILGQNSRK